MAIDVKTTFEKFDDDFLKFDQVENKRSQRPDLHAFLLLDELVPGTSDIISAAEHDVFFLDVDIDVLAEVATETQIQELHRCGVRYGEYGCLEMFA